MESQSSGASDLGAGGMGMESQMIRGPQIGMGGEGNLSRGPRNDLKSEAYLALDTEDPCVLTLEGHTLEVPTHQTE